MTFTNGPHIPPKYYGYKGGYSTITVCEDCERTALYEDAHPVTPCHECGGKVHDGWIDKCMAGKWIPPVYKRIAVLKRVLVSKGRWDIKDFDYIPHMRKIKAARKPRN